jgi:hypothetical protein
MPTAKSMMGKIADNTRSDSWSRKLRNRRFGMFLNALQVNSKDRILDVGGAESTWLNTGMEERVTLLNIAFFEKCGKFHYLECDACDMHMLASNSFDIVYSNSVIEHVGPTKHASFAHEVRRVGQRYWIQTPYKHFPIEPHFLFPLFQYFPLSVKRFIGLRWKYSHLKANGEDILDELNRLQLLSKEDLRVLFPDATLFEEKFLGLTKSLIAYRASLSDRG